MEKDAVKSLSLVKVYQGKGRGEALKGVDLSIGKGELLTLLGPNGAGKTTFLRVISTQLVQIQSPKSLCWLQHTLKFLLTKSTQHPTE